MSSNEPDEPAQTQRGLDLSEEANHDTEESEAPGSGTVNTLKKRNVPQSAAGIPEQIGEDQPSMKPPLERQLSTKFAKEQNIPDLKMGPEYVVQIDEKPAGFVFSGRVIFSVDKRGQMGGKIEPESAILKVNDIEVNDKNVASVYHSTPAPLTLTLAHIESDQIKLRDNFAEEDIKFDKAAFFELMVVYLSVTIDFLGVATISPMLPFLAIDFGANNSELGLLVSVYQGAAVLGGLLTGAIAQRYGTKFAICYSIFGSCLSFAAQGLAPSYWALFATRIFGGLTGNSTSVALLHIGLAVPAALRPRYMSYVGLCATLAFTIGPLIGGSLSKYGLEVPFFVASGIAGLGGILALVRLRNLMPAKKSATDKGKVTKHNVAMIAMVFMKSLPYSITMSMLSPYLIAQFDFRPSDLGLLITGFGAIMGMSTLFVFPFVNKKLGLYYTFMLGSFMMCGGYLVMSFLGSWWTFFIVLAVFSGSGSGFIGNSINPLQDHWASPSNKSMVMSIGAAMDSVGSMVGPLMFGAVFDATTLLGYPQAMWWLASGLAFISLVTMIVLHKTMFNPGELEIIRRKKQKELEARQHLIEDWEDDKGTDEDFMQVGRAVCTLLSQRHYHWKGNTKAIVRLMEKLFPSQSTHSIEQNLGGIVWVQQKVEQMAMEWEEMQKKGEHPIFTEDFTPMIVKKNM